MGNHFTSIGRSSIWYVTDCFGFHPDLPLCRQQTIARKVWATPFNDWGNRATLVLYWSLDVTNSCLFIALILQHADIWQNQERPSLRMFICWFVWRKPTKCKAIFLFSEGCAVSLVKFFWGEKVKHCVVWWQVWRTQKVVIENTGWEVIGGCCLHIFKIF